jgi:hypothetical protein
MVDVLTEEIHSFKEMVDILSKLGYLTDTQKIVNTAHSG